MPLRERPQANPVLSAGNHGKTVDSPLNGVNVADELLAAVGRGQIAALRGDWKDEGTIGNATLAHLLARPKIFGREVVLA